MARLRQQIEMQSRDGQYEKAEHFEHGAIRYGVGDLVLGRRCCRMQVLLHWTTARLRRFNGISNGTPCRSKFLLSESNSGGCDAFGMDLGLDTLRARSCVRRSLANGPLTGVSRTGKAILANAMGRFAAAEAIMSFLPSGAGGHRKRLMCVLPPCGRP